MTTPARASNKTATFTAAQYNTNVRDNFTAIWVYTTAGDISYATGSATLARLGIGTSYQFLQSSGTAPTWGGLSFATVYNSTSQNVLDNTWTNLAFDSEESDTPGWHSTSSNNSRITASTTGFFIASAKVVYAGAGGSGTYRDDVDIEIDGASVVAAQTSWVEVNAFSKRYSITTPVFSMSAGSYVEVWLRQTSGGTRAVDGGQYGTRFSLWRVR